MSLLDLGFRARLIDLRIQIYSVVLRLSRVLFQIVGSRCSLALRWYCSACSRPVQVNYAESSYVSTISLYVGGVNRWCHYYRNPPSDHATSLTASWLLHVIVLHILAITYNPGKVDHVLMIWSRSTTFSPADRSTAFGKPFALTHVQSMRSQKQSCTAHGWQCGSEQPWAVDISTGNFSINLQKKRCSDLCARSQKTIVWRLL